MSQMIIIFDKSDCELLIDLEAMRAYNESWGSKTLLTQKEAIKKKFTQKFPKFDNVCRLDNSMTTGHYYILKR